MMVLAGIGFLAIIYIHARWLEVLVLAIAIGFSLAGLGGYALRWKHREPPSSN